MDGRPNILEVVRRVRVLLSAYDDASAVLSCAFEEPEVNAAAGHLRSAATTAADAAFRFLSTIEKTPAYAALRSERLEQIYGRHDDR